MRKPPTLFYDITIMADYLQSTQKCIWTKNSSELESIRNSKQTSDSFSPDEEVLVVRHYIDEIRRVCFSQPVDEKFKHRLFWTAATLYKRFYLGTSVLLTNPISMVYTSVFVAGKVEEIPMTKQFRGVDVDKLSETLGSRDVVIGNEIKFLDGIKFHLLLFHPVRPLVGYVSKLKEQQPSFDWIQLQESAISLLEKSLHYDYCFTHSPAQLAVAAIMAVLLESPQDFPITCRDFIKNVLPAPANTELLFELASSVGNLDVDIRRDMDAFKGNSSIQNFAQQWKSEVESKPSRIEKRKLT